METLHKPSLFWDVQAVDTIKNSSFVMDRILNYGDIEDFKWAIGVYGSDTMKKHIQNAKNLDNKSFSFWLKYFNIDETKCIQKQSIARQSAFWRR